MELKSVEMRVLRKDYLLADLMGEKLGMRTVGWLGCIAAPLKE
jgi:hypothetical protein